MNNDEFLWVQKYRPSTVEECIVSSDVKETIKSFIDNGSVPNMIFSGSAGLGKTSMALAICDELGADRFVVNGSLDRNVDTLRNEIQSFSSTLSLRGGRKYVIIDEADYLNVNSTQPALRNFLETYSKNTGFILTVNYADKLIEPLRSRFSEIKFEVPRGETVSIASQLYKKLISILDNENISYDKKVIMKLVEKYFPDFRRTINELQRYSSKGSIDSGILSTFVTKGYDILIQHMKSKNFTEVRKWVGENSYNDSNLIFNDFYNNCSVYFKASSIPQVIVTLGKYQYQSAFAANQEINLAACLAEIMCDVEFN